MKKRIEYEGVLARRFPNGDLVCIKRKVHIAISEFRVSACRSCRSIQIMGCDCNNHGEKIIIGGDEAEMIGLFMKDGKNRSLFLSSDYLEDEGKWVRKSEYKVDGQIVETPARWLPTDVPL